MTERSAIVRFKAADEDAYFLAWTTTPWTLPSNLALAVHPDTIYAHIKVGDERYLLAENLVSGYFDDYELLSTHSGSELEGLSYKPIFDYFRDQPDAFKILNADYVTTEDGTGIVHQAPAFDHLPEVRHRCGDPGGHGRKVYFAGA